MQSRVRVEKAFCASVVGLLLVSGLRNLPAESDEIDMPSHFVRAEAEVPRSITDDELGRSAAFDEKVRRARNRVISNMLVSVSFAAFVSLLLQAVYNYAAIAPPGIRWDEFQLGTGINSTDATVIVLGLLTVVAALSIALATMTAQQAKLPEDQFAALSVWSHHTSAASWLISIFSLSTALTQVFAEPDERRPVLTVALICVGVVAIFLSTAVTTWVGAKEQIEWSLRRRYILLVSRLEDVPFGRSMTVDGASNRRYAKFVATSAALTFVAVISVRGLLDTLTAESVPWRINIVGLPLLVAAITWVTVAAIMSRWRSRAQPSVVDRWSLFTLHLASASLLTFALMAVALTAGSIVVGFSLAVLWLGSVVVPSLLLWWAMRNGRGPAVFAVQRHVMWLHEQANEMGHRLAVSRTDDAESVAMTRA